MTGLPQALPETADTIVVGGGIIGLMTAYHLQKAGRQVLVLDAGPEGSGTSAGNAGMIVPSHVIPLSAPGVISQGLRWMMRRDAPFHLRPQLDAAFLRWLWDFRAHCTAAHVERCIPLLRDLSLASVEGFDELAAEGDDFGLAHTGLLMVYRTESMQEAMLHEADVAREAGLLVQCLDRAQLDAVQPHLRGEATGAILYEQDGRVDPNLLLATLARRIRGAGGRIMHGVRATAVRSGGVDAEILQNGDATAAGQPARRGWPWFAGRKLGSAALAHHTTKCRAAVICAGAWTPHLFSGARIQPAKGYSVTVEPPTGTPPIPMILMEDRVTVTLMPGKLRFGGTLSLSGFESRVDRLRLQPILREAARYRPDVDVEQLPVWHGYRPASPDGLPFIGQVSDRVWVNSGHGMMGVSLAPASGKIAAGLVTGNEGPVSAAPFNPRR